MRIVKKIIFEGMFDRSTVEYDGDNKYNFYNLEDDFYFTYDVEDNQFTEKCDMNLSEAQLNKIEDEILAFHKDREDDKRKEMERTEDEEPFYMTNQEEYKAFY